MYKRAHITCKGLTNSCVGPHSLQTAQARYQSMGSPHAGVKFRGTQYPHPKKPARSRKIWYNIPHATHLPHINSISDLATGNGNDVTPFSQQSVVLTKQAYIQLKWEANYWRAQHTRLLEREAALKAEVETLHATIRDLTQRLYGAKSEKTAGCDAAGQAK